jgi:hypothetical protein
MPSFTAYSYAPPSKFDPIALKPLPSLRPPNTFRLPAAILSKIGVQEQQGTSMMSWINCGSCACNVVPREAVYEISDEHRSDTVVSREKTVEAIKPHLNDAARKQEYESEWKRLKRHSVKVPRVSFQQFFEEKGHLEVDEFR